MEIADRIKQAYKEVSLGEGALALSLKAVAEAAETELETLRELYTTARSIQQDIWVDYFRVTLETIEAAEEWPEYIVREKLLAFYYTLIEVMAADVTFLKLFDDQLGIWNYNPPFLQPFKALYLGMIAQMVEEGQETGEVTDRYMLSGEYTSWHWPQMLYLLNYWLDDTSEEKQKTDQAIEKSVNLGFDIMGRNVLDSVFDFLKFVFVGK